MLEFPRCPSHSPVCHAEPCWAREGLQQRVSSLCRHSPNRAAAGWEARKPGVKTEHAEALQALGLTCRCPQTAAGRSGSPSVLAEQTTGALVEQEGPGGLSNSRQMQALRPFGPECVCPAPTAQEEAAGKAEGGFCVFGGSRFPSPVVLHPVWNGIGVLHQLTLCALKAHCKHPDSCKHLKQHVLI
ncbi:hypothetical protein Anapl_07824 [Anas platyrhynchos]|uniref:Uncharacterized protein n=1 Tax=Anas platyrhynchos TaxID=8839 RepID=R0LM60_ANAPL|nr:hypothetical protein Anapl_07824 [Anas platyrhynchos]